MSGKDQERSHRILFFVRLKKSRKTDLCSNQDISHSTDCFFFFFKDIWEIVLFMSCDESHTMTVLIFLFLIIFFYIGLKLISLIPPLFQRGFYMQFLIKNRSLTIHRSVNFTAV